MKKAIAGVLLISSFGWISAFALPAAPPSHASAIPRPVPVQHQHRCCPDLHLGVMPQMLPAEGPCGAQHRCCLRQAPASLPAAVMSRAPGADKACMAAPAGLDASRQTFRPLQPQRRILVPYSELTTVLRN